MTNQDKAPDVAEQVLLQHHKKRRKKRYRWFIPLIIVVAIGYYILRPQNEMIEFKTEQPAMGPVQQIVEATGSVEAQKEIALRFERSGTITQIYAKKGLKVEKGEVLIELDGQDEFLQMEQARAVLASAQADLDARYAPPTNADLQSVETEIETAQTNIVALVERMQEQKQVNELQLQKAELAVEQATITASIAETGLTNTTQTRNQSQQQVDLSLRNTLETLSKTAESAIDDVRHAQSVIDTILSTTTSAGKARQLNLGFKDPNLKNEANRNYRQHDVLIEQLESAKQAAEAEPTIEVATISLNTFEEIITTQKDHLDTVFEMLIASRSGADLSVAEIESFKASIKAEQNALIVTIATVQNARQALESADLSIDTTEVLTTEALDTADAGRQNSASALQIAESDYKRVELETKLAISALERELDQQKLMLDRAKNNKAKLLETPRSVDVAAQQALVQQRLNAWKQARNAYEETIIKAPTAGVITQVMPEIGEAAQPGTEAIQLMTNALQIAVNIPETDIDSISVGNTTSITFDAFSYDDIFTGTVVNIDPAETVIQGVIYYRIEIALDEQDDGSERIKSGMTADVEILVGEVENALTIRADALRYEENKPFVFVESEPGIQEPRSIEIGLEGERVIEVTSGLSLDDEVVLYEITEE
jgi:HlyD family secretion protein